jgi:hypothetical protein
VISSYELAVSSLAPVSAAAYVNFWVPAGRAAEIVHIEVWQTTTTALPQLQLIKTTARGTQTTTVTPTSAANATNSSYMATPTAVIDTAWSVQPTIAAFALRMPDVAGTTGTSFFWDWGDQDPLQIGSSATAGGLAIWNASGGTTGVIRAQFKWRE